MNRDNAKMLFSRKEEEIRVLSFITKSRLLLQTQQEVTPVQA